MSSNTRVHAPGAYEVFLARWGRRLSWQEVAHVFHTSWEQVYRSVGSVVGYGLAHRSLDEIEAIGVDEVQYRRGHQYVTVVYQLDSGCRRLLYVGKKRTVRSLLGFFRLLGRAVVRSLSISARTCGSRI